MSLADLAVYDLQARRLWISGQWVEEVDFASRFGVTIVFPLKPLPEPPAAQTGEEKT